MSLDWSSLLGARSLEKGQSAVGTHQKGITANVVDYKYSLHGLSEDDHYTRILSEVHLRSAKRILKLCQINQGFYIKAGQFVASMPQVPKEYSSTLVSLQDQAVPCSFEAIKQVLINNLGSDLKQIFLSIDEQPIAAASLAQAHRALLKDQEEVVLKVNFPELQELRLRELPSVKALWHLEVPEESFGKLKVLKITRCNAISKLIPVNMAKRLKNLESLSVINCDMVEEIFELEDLVDEITIKSVNLPPLKELVLCGLSELIHMWWNKGSFGYVACNF